VPDAEQEVGVIFPTKGVEASCEFSKQPADTAPVGVNVRTYECITLRSRGGSRSGLTQYIPAQPAGANPIQHLNVLVDPQDPSLDITGGTVPDPSTNNLSIRNPGRFVPVGGSGQQLNRNVVSNAPKPGNLIQAVGFTGSAANGLPFTIGYTVGSPVVGTTISLPSRPQFGNLLVMVLFGTGVPPNSSTSVAAPVFSGVTAGGGASWTQVGGSGYNQSANWANSTGTNAPATFGASIQIFYYYATGGAGDQNINVATFAGMSGDTTVFANGSVMEYSLMAGAPISQVKFSQPANTAPWTVGPLSLSNLPNELVIAAFTGAVTPLYAGPITPTMTGGFTSRPVFLQADELNSSLVVMDKKGTQATTITPGVTVSPAGAYLGMATAFNPH
jgi:hypothetical protein